MTKFYKEMEELPATYYWKDQIVTLPGIKKQCIGYFYLLAMIDLASRNPYASLHELYILGLQENTFQLSYDSPPSYSNIYTGINYALKEVPEEYRPQTLKKYVNKAAMDLQLFRQDPKNRQNALASKL